MIKSVLVCMDATMQYTKKVYLCTIGYVLYENKGSKWTLCNFGNPGQIHISISSCVCICLLHKISSSFVCCRFCTKIRLLFCVECTCICYKKKTIDIYHIIWRSMLLMVIVKIWIFMCGHCATPEFQRFWSNTHFGVGKTKKQRGNWSIDEELDLARDFVHWVLSSLYENSSTFLCWMKKKTIDTYYCVWWSFPKYKFSCLQFIEFRLLCNHTFVYVCCTHTKSIFISALNACMHLHVNVCLTNMNRCHCTICPIKQWTLFNFLPVRRD